MKAKKVVKRDTAKRFTIMLIRRYTTQFAQSLDKWVLTTDHKKIGIMYLAVGTFCGFIGFAFSTVIRLELSNAAPQILGTNIHYYYVTVTMHGLIMIFFKVIILCISKFLPQKLLKFLFFTLWEPFLIGTTATILFINLNFI